MFIQNKGQITKKLYNYRLWYNAKHNDTKLKPCECIHNTKRLITILFFPHSSLMNQSNTTGDTSGSGTS